MKFLIILLILTKFAYAHPIKSSFYSGYGEFACNFLDGEIIRPNTLTWHFEILSENPARIVISGNLATINSFPLYTTATEVEEGKFVLQNEQGVKEGSLECAENVCHIELSYMTNFIGTSKAPQTLKAKWTFDDKGFNQEGTLVSTPSILDCRFQDRLHDVGL